MAVVKGFQKIGIFEVVSQKFVSGASNTRGLCLSLILLCFFSSMLITNDVALITFVPFSILVLELTGQTEHLITVTALQTIAANLGSMLTPVGNPQNLYLYTFYSMGIPEFMKITLPISAVSLILIIISALFIRGNNINVEFKEKMKISSKNRLFLSIFLFAMCLLSVFHILNHFILLAIVIAGIFISDKKIFKELDYGLLATFVCFFIFVGNLSQISAVKSALSSLISGNELIWSIILSQFISNVPAAVLLSGFTSNGKTLLLGTNIGGLGSLVASLASLISYKLYIKEPSAKPGKYLLIFTILNILILLPLTIIALML